MNTNKTDTRPPWARGTLRPECPLCGNYLMPCTATASGIHPDTLTARHVADSLGISLADAELLTSGGDWRDRLFALSDSDGGNVAARAGVISRENGATMDIAYWRALYEFDHNLI